MTRKIAMALGAAVLATLTFGAAAQAEVRTRTFDYTERDTALEGFMAWDDSASGKRPGVLIFSQWTGISDHERGVARDLAKLGYVAMVADVYGKGVNPKAPKESGVEMGKYMSDRPLLRARAKAGLDRLVAEANVDASKLAAIGYCFGGAGVLELGRQGADVKAIVSLHGSLSNPTPEDARNIKAKVLVLHGADDPAVPLKDVEAFKAEMKAAGTDLQFVAYSQTVHSFTMPSAGNDNAKGSAYNERSAKRAWASMQSFLKETLD
ncbi:MAG: dienelactone hydrolase [Hyphomicrobiales bacterium]|nr:dienelactone hydrolase [Hyphomicrobiales bacterium]